jgi:hypothetical protein
MSTKLHFLQHQYIDILKSVPTDEPARFGKMNVHQMIEHMSYAFRQASGLIPLAPANDEATTQKMYTFMMSDKPFRNNTPNPYLPDEPAMPEQDEISDSIQILQNDIEVFVDTFRDRDELRILNPFFGNLNQAEWIHLLHKHAWHHLRQFGVESPLT